jgi:hypothetical protein
VYKFLNPFADWIETVVGCRRESALIFEADLPFGDLATAELFPQLRAPEKCAASVDSLRLSLDGYELPAPEGVRLGLGPTYQGPGRGVVWDSDWKETPVAFRFRPLRHGVVWAKSDCEHLHGAMDAG